MHSQLPHLLAVKLTHPPGGQPNTLLLLVFQNFQCEMGAEEMGVMIDVGGEMGDEKREMRRDERRDDRYGRRDPDPQVGWCRSRIRIHITTYADPHH